MGGCWCGWKTYWCSWPMLYFVIFALLAIGFPCSISPSSTVFEWMIGGSTGLSASWLGARWADGE